MEDNFFLAKLIYELKESKLKFLLYKKQKYSLLYFYTRILKDRSFFPNYPLVISLKNLLIFAVFSEPSEFLIILKNSVNSI